MVKIPVDGNRKKEKGLTLVEVIVSLSIIVIISIAAMSISVFSSTTFNNLNVKRFFQREIDNIAEIYLSYDSEHFQTAFNDLTGKTISDYMGSAKSKFYHLDSSFNYVDVESTYKIKIECSDDGNSMTISSFKSDDSLINSRSVSKK